MTKPFVLACALLALAAPARALSDPAVDTPPDTLSQAATGRVPPGPAGSPFAAPGLAGPPPGNALNPAISVIGWFQAVGGNDPTTQERPFEFREAELAFQAAVDPYSRADIFLAASPEGFELEEASLTWLALPGGGQARVGKLRADFGKFNRTHPPETPFADRPLAAEAFLGEEGLITAGAALSALVPNPADLYWDVIATVGTVPDEEESPLFAAEERSDLMVLGRTSLFVPLGEAADLNLGVSYANARARPDLREPEGDRAQLGGADLTFRWKNPRRSIYRSLMVQAEVLGERGSGDDAPDRLGGFGYALWQFARRWKLGARLDHTQAPGSDAWTRGALALLQFQPSEFSVVSVQGRRVREPDGAERDAAFLKWTFNIGPHGAHPY